MCATPTKRLMSRREAAEWLGMSLSSFDTLMGSGKGPKRLKFGDTAQATVKFDVRDLEAWLDLHRV